MTYKNPTTGKTYADIDEALDDFCTGRACDGCPIYNTIGATFCGAWCKDHPADAARIMGLEVVDGTPAKPRLAEILGVEVGEKFNVIDPDGAAMGPFCINSEGAMVYYDDPNRLSDEVVYIAINHPESIVRLPRLTEAELAICRAVGAKWVSRNQTGTNALHLWSKKPSGDRNFWNGDATLLATIDEKLFPSVRPGDCISVEEATP